MTGPTVDVHFGTVLLCLLVVQNTATTLLARYTRTNYNYNVNHMLLISEVMKLVSSIALEAITYYNKISVSEQDAFLPLTTLAIENKLFVPVRAIVSRFSAFLESFRVHVIQNPCDALKLTIPSGLYLMQNSLVYYSISLVPVPLFQITQQTKLVTTAILSVLVLKRTYVPLQWYSILSLCLGAAICILSKNESPVVKSVFSLGAAEESEERDYVGENTTECIFGLLLVLLSNLSSSIAGIYFEVVIKSNSTKEEAQGVQHALPSIWMRNIQLAFFTLCIICTQLLLSNERKPFLYDFTPLLWVQMSMFAFGGLLVAYVIKYTDSVQKGLATGLSVITSSALSVMIEGDVVALNFVFGSVLAIGGCFIFANPDIGVKLNTKRDCCHGHFKISSIMKTCISPKYMVSLISIFCMCSTMMHNGYLLDRLHNDSTYEVQVRGWKDLPDDWKDRVHIHVYVMGPIHRKAIRNCGGCMVLWELVSSVANLGISTSSSIGCPANNQTDLEQAAASGKSVAIVYPEIIGKTCTVTGNVVHVRWILAPLTSHNSYDFYKKWDEEDLVFNYASSTAVHPERLPRSNILQVITSPMEGDQFDLPPATFSNITNRNGTAWIVRKAEIWHHEIDYIHRRLPEPHHKLVNPTVAELQQYEYFVSYDPYTFYSYSAAMSGALSIVLPIANVTKKEWALGTYVGEYLKENIGDVPGIAYGLSDEEIEYARRTMPNLRQFMMNVRKWGKETTVPRFIRDCYRYGQGERAFEAGMLVRDAYTKWYNNSTLVVNY